MSYPPEIPFIEIYEAYKFRRACPKESIRQASQDVCPGRSRRRPGRRCCAARIGIVGRDCSSCSRGESATSRNRLPRDLSPDPTGNPSDTSPSTTPIRFRAFRTIPRDSAKDFPRSLFFPEIRPLNILPAKTSRRSSPRRLTNNSPYNTRSWSPPEPRTPIRPPWEDDIPCSQDPIESQNLSECSNGSNPPWRSASSQRPPRRSS